MRSIKVSLVIIAYFYFRELKSLNLLNLLEQTRGLQWDILEQASHGTQCQRVELNNVGYLLDIIFIYKLDMFVFNF